MVERVGISMHVAVDRHGETRDCLARNWSHYMAATLPGVSWMPLPNVGAAIIDTINMWKLDGFILTGGNDIGEYSERDTTEKVVLDYAIEHHLPVFGVCRGLHLLQHVLGGQLKRCRHEAHVATQHSIILFKDRFTFDAPALATVNSYHEWAIPETSVAAGLVPLAISEDGWVEAVRHRAAPITAVQWHPERDNPAADLDRKLLLSTMKGQR